LSQLIVIMTTKEQIAAHLSTLPEQKRTEMQALHERILKAAPGCRLWFSDGKNEAGKVIANPTIGYGQYTIRYVNGTTADSFRIGLSANATGISMYILGLEDKKYLTETYGSKIGKASVTGYCIKFKSIKDINLDVLEAAIRYGIELGMLQ